MKFWGILFLCFQSSIQAIYVRPVVVEDIPATLELDHRVSFEFFEPLMKQAFMHYGLDIDIQSFLHDELEHDVRAFYACVNQNDDQRLHIAIDESNHVTCGLLLFHKTGSEIELDLLLVDKDYRNKGVGKQLVRSAFEVFDAITACVVYPLNYKNEPTLKFYESLGFKNLGPAPWSRINYQLYHYLRLTF